MSLRRPDQNEFDDIPSVPGETEFLLADVEELVNLNVRKFLDDSPFKIRAQGYRPELLHGEKPASIDTLEADFLMDVGSFEREFVSMDLLFDFPLLKGGENPWNITVKWSDGIQIRLAVVDKRPILLVEESKEDGRTYDARILHPEVMAGYVEQLGLPASFWGNEVKEITRDLYNCPEFFMTQSAATIVDPFTKIEVVHDAQMRQDIDDDKQLVQELLVNIDHLEQHPSTNEENVLSPMPYLRFRNMLRFTHDEVNGLWQFKGAYHGKLNVGDLLDELVQVNPQLGIPGSKVLEKVFNGLNN